MYCLICGKPLKKIKENLRDLPTYECKNCGTIKTHAEMKLIEPYEIVKIRELLKENILLKSEIDLIKKRLTRLEEI